ncbi:hypothetical protein [Streptomyces anulatus]|uniref:hypothetical protein n=1 Tax=Streptomyces anulatus TaxID=1892 RepID=UPI003421722D
MANEKAMISKVFGLLILALTAVMVIALAVMPATGTEPVPVMAAPVVFLVIGVLMTRYGRRSA